MTHAPATSIRPPSERHPYLTALLNNLSKIVALVLILAALLMFFGYMPDISRDLKVVGLAFVSFLWPGSYIGEWIQENRDDPQVVLFVDVEPLELDGRIAAIPLADFAELEVTDGELDQWAPLLYAGRHLDLEEMTCEGVWTGTLSDRQLIASLQAVYECREMLEEDAQKAVAYETNFWSIVRTATKDAVLSVVRTFERNSLPDEGEGVERAVNDAIEQFDLQRRVDSADDLADVDLDDLDEQLQDDHPDPEPSAEQTADREPDAQALPTDD